MNGRPSARRRPRRPHRSDALPRAEWLETRQLLATFTVTSAADTGDGTLRDAIERANALAGPDTVLFAITPDGRKTINLSTALPQITDPLAIDGRTQPLAAADDPDPPRIRIAGAGAGTAVGLNFSAGASGSIVRGLAITNFSSDGIRLAGDGNLIEGNYIGLGFSGDADEGNGGDGIEVNGSQNTIGGASALQRNLISGNGGSGVRLGGTENRIIGNLIGTDVTGATAVSNDIDGVGVFGDGNFIGGTDTGERNVISGNRYGISFSFLTNEGGGSRNTVAGNFIGTSSDGSQSLGNRLGGIRGGDFTSNTIGGPTEAARNIISGNGGIGINLEGQATAGGFVVPNTVQGNYIGTDVSGDLDLGNAGFGISLSTVGSLIGGGSPEAGNLIAFNDGVGVGISASVNNNRILSNSIFSNGSLGIDLFQPGAVIEPLLNDSMDADTSNQRFANEGQNWPVIDAANFGGGAVLIRGTLNSNPSTMFTLQFFVNDAADPSGFGEGQTFLTEMMVQTDGNGDTSFNMQLNQEGLTDSQFITATATDSRGNTSEFSRAVQLEALEPADLVAMSSATPNPVNLGQDLTFSITVTNNSQIDATGVVVTDRLDPSVDFVSGTRGARFDNGVVRFDPVRLSVGERLTFTYIVRPTRIGTISNDVRVETQDIDPDPSNNQPSTDVDVVVPPGTSIFNFSAAQYSAIENDGQAKITVQRSNGDAPVEVAYRAEADSRTEANSATAGADFTPVMGILRFEQGQMSATFDIPLIDDNDVEVPEIETVLLTLSDPSGDAVLGMLFQATLEIEDNDPGPPPAGRFRFGASTFTVVEGQPFATIPVERVGGFEGEARVRFQTVNGTATAGSDFDPFDFELVFSANDRAPKLVLVPIIDDATPEANESFNVTLSDANIASIGSPSTATVTINNDDPFPTPPSEQLFTLSADTYSAAENTTRADIIIRRDSGAGAVSVRVRTSDAVGAANSRYLPVDTVVNFGEGELEQVVPVVLINNSVADGNANVLVTLSDPDGGPMLGDPSAAVLTIVDDDTDGTPPPPTPTSSTIQFAIRTTTVDESAGVASVTLTRTGDLSSRATLTVVPRAGDAQAGLDYDNTPIPVVFEASQSSATIAVPILDDTFAEADSAFGLFITNVSAGGASVGLGTIDSAIIIIQDNDAVIPPVDPGTPGGPTVLDVSFVGPIAAPIGLAITFSEPLLTTPAASAFSIVSSGRDQVFGTADDRVIPISDVGYDALTNQVAVVTATPLRLGQTYRLAVDGVTDQAIRDLAGTPLDGDGDGLSGGYYFADLSRASFHRYLDNDGDQVRLLLRGGLLDVIRPVGQNPDVVRIVQAPPRGATLLGDVQRRRRGSDGVTTIGRLEGIDSFGAVRVRLTTPPFFIGSIPPSAVDDVLAPILLSRLDRRGGRDA